MTPPPPPPPPTPPPDRPTDDKFRYHAYDYQNSTPFTASPGQAQRQGREFFSLVQDLNALVRYGRWNQVPNITLTAVGAPVVRSPALGNVYTLALSFGNKTGLKDPPTVVFTGGIHACEWMGTEIPYLLAEYLIKHYPGPGQPLNPINRTIRDLVDTRRIHIVPMLNPEGNLASVFTPGAVAQLWRKNLRALPTTPDKWIDALTYEAPGTPDRTPNSPFRNVGLTASGAKARYDVPDYAPKPSDLLSYQTAELPNGKIGVDLNRNCTTMAWGMNTGLLSHQGDPSSDAYFGPESDSEAETRNIESFLLRNATPGLTTSIDYHSYGRFIIYSGEAANAGKLSGETIALGKVLFDLIRSEDGTAYELGTPLQTVAYEATGTLTDHVTQYHRAHAFAIELDPGGGLDNNKFFPPDTAIRRVFETNIRGALAAMAVPRPGTPNAMGSITAAGKRFAAWKVYGRGNLLPQP